VSCGTAEVPRGFLYATQCPTPVAFIRFVPEHQVGEFLGQLLSNRLAVYLSLRLGLAHYLQLICAVMTSCILQGTLQFIMRQLIELANLLPVAACMLNDAKRFSQGIFVTNQIYGLLKHNYTHIPGLEN
jgi:hypothetical protein